ncbi:A/G-specific adenine glycosylase [Noviherbaspirillum sp.]|jgi:A/G-specific adenine glycosylase|uniref:A/G-specific adenine glycosylase n=1 Tax=Noviherbaspirillum sp. TaxID=1926288 RepID=UPI0025EDD699|nr:A/G-specific adenine glycosylase [Noviherbaspirillum sp.]
MKRIAQAPAAKADGAETLFDPTFSEAVIRWQKQHGRHALPWQNTRDAYRIWLSEIMLQQTQVAAVIPYYQRFLARFPDVASLAVASSEEVMSHWSGLGYYSRARNLHRCAQIIVAEFDGKFPEHPELLAELPGIGRSTAAAIAAFAYGARAAILDGNVKRVFARVFGIEGFPGAKPVEDGLWRRAVALLPSKDVEAYTQGLMDLGATLCTRSKPSCRQCPVSQRCIALASDRVHSLPERKPKKAIPERATAMLVVTDRDHVLLEQRPGSGIWGGLLSLPELEGEERDLGEGRQRFDELVSRKLASFGHVVSCERLQPFTHVFTHFKLHVSPYQIRLASRAQLAAEASHVWYRAEQLQDAPLPAPVKKLLLAVFRGGDLLTA